MAAVASTCGGVPATDTGIPEAAGMKQSGAPVVRRNRFEILLYYMYFSPQLGEEDTKYVLAWQKKLTSSLGLCGRVLVSSQGINGNVAGPGTATAAYIKQVEEFVLPEGYSVEYYFWGNFCDKKLSR